MEIIKEAFVEGRETETDWHESTAKKNALKMDVALENFSSMSSRERHSLIPLSKICPETGNVLATFPSRLAACRHICTDILKRPNKNPISVGGNLEMCMRAGWKSYGFYWKIGDAADGHKEWSGSGGKREPTGCKPVYYRAGEKETIFKTIADAARHFGVDHKTVRNAVNNPQAKNAFLKGAMLRFANPTPKIIHVDSIEEIAAHSGYSVNGLSKLIRNGLRTINNYTYDLKRDRPKTKVFRGSDKYKLVSYDLFDNGVNMGSFKSITDMAKECKVPRPNANKRLIKGLSLDVAGRFVAKPRFILKAKNE